MSTEKYASINQPFSVSTEELELMKTKALSLQIESKVARMIYEQASIDHFLDAFSEKHGCSFHGAEGRIDFSDGTIVVKLLIVEWHWSGMKVKYNLKIKKGWSAKTGCIDAEYLLTSFFITI